MNKKKTLSVCVTLLALLFSVFGTAAAHVDNSQQFQSITAGTPTVQPTETGTGVVNYSQPIVSLLDAFFGSLFGTPVPTDTPAPIGTPVTSGTPVPGGTPVVTDTPVPGGTPVASETAVVDGTPTGITPVPTDEAGLTVGEQVAGYHADGMGFGVLVKIYSMAAASKAACDSAAGAATTSAGDTTTATTCVPVTVDELVTAFKSGKGMGELMKEYGRPSMMGVGQVRKALKNEQNQDTQNAPQQSKPGNSSNNGNGNGNGKGKNK
jgi:hypothetical protein